MGVTEFSFAQVLFVFHLFLILNCQIRKFGKYREVHRQCRAVYVCFIIQQTKATLKEAEFCWLEERQIIDTLCLEGLGHPKFRESQCSIEVTDVLMHPDLLESLLNMIYFWGLPLETLFPHVGQGPRIDAWPTGALNTFLLNDRMNSNAGNPRTIL